MEEEELWSHIALRLRHHASSEAVPPPPPAPQDSSSCRVRWSGRRLEELLPSLPAATAYPELTKRIAPILHKWFDRFEPSVWARFVKIADSGVGRTRQLPKVLKEFNESAPALARLLDWLEDNLGAGNPAVDVVDLCSGFGFLAMFASELAPPGSIECIYLVDHSWPNRSNGSAGLISTEHIYQSGPWRIPLVTLKIDLGKGGDIRGLAKHVLWEPRPTLLLGIHLCGALSLRACQIFNDSLSGGFGVTGLILAPCCLPRQQHTKRRFIYDVGGYRFAAAQLRRSASDDGPEQKAFDVYTEHLLACLEAPEKKREVVQIQSWGSHSKAEESRQAPDVFLTARAPFKHPGGVPDPRHFGRPVVVEGDGISENFVAAAAG